MAELVFNAEVRNKIGKEDAKKLRFRSLVPAVVYGKDVQPVHCAVSKIELMKLRKANRNALITLKLGSEDRTVIVRDVQKHPTTHEYQHLDFQAVSMEHPIKVDVDLKYVGTPIGRKSGGIFTSLLDEIKIECLPNLIPEVIKLNIDDLEAGETLHVSDIKAEGYTIITNAKIALCQVSKVKASEEDEAAEAGAAPAGKAAAKPAAKPAAKAK
jgi:large subunit ribosomal protein L25